jgi:hypothetical protein
LYELLKKFDAMRYEQIDAFIRARLKAYTNTSKTEWYSALFPQVFDESYFLNESNAEREYRA